MTTKTEVLQDAAELAAGYLPIIIMYVLGASDVTKSEDARKNDEKMAIGILQKLQVALYEAGA